MSPGYEKVTITIAAKADGSDAELDDLLAFAQGHAPVCQSVCRPVPVVFERA